MIYYLSKRKTKERGKMSYATSTTQHSRGLRVFAVILAIVSLGYMFPWAYAVFSGSEKIALVWWINLLTGWTVLGWGAALVLAMVS
jgi:hypothetical protein